MVAYNVQMKINVKYVIKTLNCLFIMEIVHYNVHNKDNLMIKIVAYHAYKTVKHVKI